MTVARKPDHRGERVISRKPLRREGRTASAEPVCSCAFLYPILHARPRVQRAPGLPCALDFNEGKRICKTWATRAAGIAKMCLRQGCSNLRTRERASPLPLWERRRPPSAAASFERTPKQKLRLCHIDRCDP